MRDYVSTVKGFLLGLVKILTVKGREVLNSSGGDSQGDLVVICICCTVTQREAQLYDLIGPQRPLSMKFQQALQGTRKLLNILRVFTL